MIDLPEPDSPTRQSSSPRSIRRSTPQTASSRSAPRGSCTVRPSIESVGEGALILHTSPAEARVERIPEPVAEEVYRQHGDGQEKAGEEDGVGIQIELQAAFGHEISPGRYFGWNPQTEEAQDRLAQDRRGAGVRALNKDRGKRVRQHVPEEKRRRQRSHRDRRFH